MKYQFALPFESAPPQEAFLHQDAIMELSAFAEENGFAGVNLTEHPIPDQTWRETSNSAHDALDPFVGLTYAAAATRKIKVLTHLIVSPYRNPFLLAKSVASLDRLSGGRLMLGLGIGYQEAEFAALGVDFAERNALFDEGLEAMKLAWTGEPVNFEGRHFSARNVTAQPTPAQKPNPELWFGGNTNVTFRRIVKHGGGWLILPRSLDRVGGDPSKVLSLENLPSWFEKLNAVAKAAGYTQPIESHFPIYEYNNIDQSKKLEAVQRLQDCGVGWTSWHAYAHTVQGQKDDIKRFCDEVMSKVPPEAP